jgi:Domain of unknown function (DUF4832)
MCKTTLKQKYLFPVLVILLLFVSCNSSSQTSPKGREFVPPAYIDINENEIVNSGRGFYRWINQEQAPIECKDRYNRFNWSVIEPTQGNYDFSKIETEAAFAAAAGGTFGFGVRCVVSGTAQAYPSYLDAMMSGWYSNNKLCWVPDWNDNDFLARVEALISALGAQYNNDARIGYIEIRTYGNWGEWHMSGFETPVLPAIPITTASIQRIIDAWVNAFPDKQIIMMSDNGVGLNYAMNKTGLTYPIGWRRDSWCNNRFVAIKTDDVAAWNSAKDRWKVAPVIIESYSSGGVTTSLGLQQIIDYHVSAIGNGNFGTWSSFTEQQQNDLLISAKTSGYRYSINRLVLPENINRGNAFTFSASWSNRGVAPIYRNWNIIYRLCNQSSDVVVWEGVSSLNLRTIIPTFDRTTLIDMPVVANDTFTIPLSVPAGLYNIDIIITDPTGYYSDPLKLAMTERKSNGAYTFGTVIVK